MCVTVPTPATTFTQQRIFFESPLHIEEEGFLFVYLSYDNDSNVIQYNEYYPYGLQTRNSWTRDGSQNNFLHNGGTELNSSSGYYDLFYRNYDAAIGKFIQADPMAHMDHSVSPYAYAGNNPLMFNDPLGDVKITQETPMYNPNAGWGSFALSVGAFYEWSYPVGFASVDASISFRGISQDGYESIYGTNGTEDVAGIRWNPHGGVQITYDEWRALGGNDSRATDKDLFFSGGWEVEQEVMSPNSYFEGVAVYGSEFGDLKNGAAMTLPGVGIFVNPKDLTNVDLLRHEFGHILQARKYGLQFFYTVIAPASLASAASKSGDHQKSWTEVQANTFSYHYFNAPADWKLYEYPIDMKYIQHGDPLLFDPTDPTN